MIEELKNMFDRNENSITRKLSDLQYDTNGGKATNYIKEKYRNATINEMRIEACIALYRLIKDTKLIEELISENEKYYTTENIINMPSYIIEKIRCSGMINRKKAEAFALHGSTRCFICGFDYGFFGKDKVGYFELHSFKTNIDPSHIEEIDLSKDIIVLCSNCHTMIHRENWNFDDVLRIKEFLRNDKNCQK